MPRRAELPPPFSDLNLKLQFIQQVSPTEYSAECLECGGTIHQDGEWPDRLRIFVGEHGRVWCRRCNLFKWADQVNGAEPPTRQDLEKWRQEQIRREEERKRSAELALANLRKGEVWKRYCNQLAGAGEEYWRGRGIPQAWQGFWGLGWEPHSQWSCPTATIPIFDPNYQVLNIKHRLIGTDASGQKYRYQLHGLPAPLWLADPEAPLVDHIVAIEGEIKAMVVKLTLDDNSTVVGLPGATPSTATVDQLRKADRVTLVLDPGAEEQAKKLSDALGGKRVKVLIPHGKVDDMIIANQMNSYDVKVLLKQAAHCG